MRKLISSEKQFEVLEGAIARLESVIVHMQREQDQIVCNQDQIFSSQDQIQSTLCGGMPSVSLKSPPSLVSLSPLSGASIFRQGISQTLSGKLPVHNPYGVGSIPSLVSSDPELQSFIDGLYQEDQAMTNTV